MSAVCEHVRDRLHRLMGIWELGRLIPVDEIFGRSRARDLLREKCSELEAAVRRAAAEGCGFCGPIAAALGPPVSRRRRFWLGAPGKTLVVLPPGWNRRRGPWDGFDWFAL